MKKSPGRKQAHPSAPGKNPTHWAAVADWYDGLVGDEGSEYHREVIIPGILRFLEIPHSPPIKNQKSKIKNPSNILDLACGQGVLCRKLAALGHHVTGIDAAAPLIAAAQKHPHAGPPIRYLTADVTRLLDSAGHLAPGLAPASFNAITLILAVQNLSPLSPLWHACRALLRPAGALLIVMMHPCFRIPRQSDWHWQDDSAGGTQSRLIRRYLSSEKIDIQTHPGLAAHGKNTASTPHFHRPLQAYFNTLGNAGLLVDHLEEWPSHKISQPGPKKKALDRARDEIPLFLALRALNVTPAVPAVPTTPATPPPSA